MEELKIVTERTLTITSCTRDSHTNDERFNLDGMKLAVFGSGNIQCDYKLVMTIINNESPYTIIIKPTGIDSETLTLFMHDLIGKYTMNTQIIQTKQDQRTLRSKILIFRLKYVKYNAHE